MPRKKKGPAKPRKQERLTLEEWKRRYTTDEGDHSEPTDSADKPLNQLLTGENIAEQNLHHFFFADYYESAEMREVLEKKFRSDKEKKKDKEAEKRELAAANAQNAAFRSCVFRSSWRPQQALEKLAREKSTRYQSFDLRTTYPGLLAGTGLPHEAGVKGELAIGFNFDYVTGLPYLPGSTVKGVLRSGFRLGGYEFVRELSDKLQGAPDGVMQALERDIFDRETGGDVFFDAYPVVDKDGPLLDTDNLAPVPTDPDSPVPVADQRRIKAPTVLAFLRVRPGVRFRFLFYLTDSTVPTGEDEEPFSFTASDKKQLFRQLILELGIGAKTNVGYGRMVLPK
ncbi:MAG: type III-B CRISPR module RAMP protein Cmr6 [Clostridiales bacterium]|nr:type III-B CRISPR module RAMP protein Cmr6 [Clostridiales bacterium]